MTDNEIFQSAEKFRSAKQNTGCQPPGTKMRTTLAGCFARWKESVQENIGNSGNIEAQPRNRCVLLKNIQFEMKIKGNLQNEHKANNTHSPGL